MGERIRSLFAALVLASLCIAVPALADEPAAAAPMPRCKIPNSQVWHPQAERGRSAVVTASFGINAHGGIDRVEILAADSKPFAAAATELLKAMRFPVTADWRENAANRRYMIDVQFLLAPCKQRPKSEHADEVIAICGSPAMR